MLKVPSMFLSSRALDNKVSCPLKYKRIYFLTGSANCSPPLLCLQRKYHVMSKGFAFMTFTVMVILLSCPPMEEADWINISSDVMEWVVVGYMGK